VLKDLDALKRPLPATVGGRDGELSVAGAERIAGAAT
jgi:hypothetical protein